jgi:opacity protein-like surface antigen
MNVKVTKTDHTSIFIAPGYLINEKALAFVKASYERFYMNSSSTISSLNMNDKLAQGIGLGVGVRTEFSNNLLLNVEISKIYYTNDFSLLNVTTGTTSGSIGLMHNFE